MGPLMILWVAFCVICFSGESKTIFLLWCSLTCVFSFFFSFRVGITNKHLIILNTSVKYKRYNAIVGPCLIFHHSRFVIHQQLSLSKNMVCKISNTMFYHICQCRVFVMTVREKGRYLTQSYDISPYTHRLIQNATWQHNNATKKLPITQRLRIDLGRSVGVTIATQLVWLNRFTGSQPSH